MHLDLQSFYTDFRSPGEHTKSTISTTNDNPTSWYRHAWRHHAWRHQASDVSWYDVSHQSEPRLTGSRRWASLVEVRISSQQCTLYSRRWWSPTCRLCLRGGGGYSAWNPAQETGHYSNIGDRTWYSSRKTGERQEKDRRKFTGEILLEKVYRRKFTGDIWIMAVR